MNWVELVLGILDRVGIYKRRPRDSKTKKPLDKLKKKHNNSK